MSRPKFGVFLPFYAFQKGSVFEYHNRLKTVVSECERLGYDSLWLDDHLMYKDWPILECWTSLATLAASTNKIRLGIMVTCVAHRYPSLLAKTAATLDILSNGRLEFGIGAGAQKAEHEAYGFEFSNPSERVERLAESLEIITQLWTQEKTNFQGRHFELKEAICEPKPLQKPHPPIVVGGKGEKLLKITAKYADRFDWGFLASIDEYEQKLGTLKTNCKIIGRDFNEIEKSLWPAGQMLVSRTQDEVNRKIAQHKPTNMTLESFRKYNLFGTPEVCIERFQTYLDLNINYFMLYFGDLPSLQSLTLFANNVADKVG